MTPLFSAAVLRTQSDERLLLLLGAGQERAFEAIVHRYRKPLERYCARALSRSQAEDVVQQVLMKAWQALHDGAEVRNLKPWLFRIAQTTIIETVQQSRFDYDELARSLSPHDGPDSELEQRAVIRKTLMGLAALPEAQREALLRNAVDGESRAEIAAALGVSEGAVRQLLYRARSSLRTAATAITPLPFVMWWASPAEAAGIAGIAKASAILAGASVIAAPVAVHELDLSGPQKARAHIEKPAATRPRGTKLPNARVSATSNRGPSVAAPQSDSRVRDESDENEGADAPESSSESSEETSREERETERPRANDDGEGRNEDRWEDSVESPRASRDSDSGVDGDSGDSGGEDE